MKILILLGFLVLSANGAVFNIQDPEMRDFVQQGLVGWNDSFWNFFDGGSDVRGKNMFCIENVFLIKMTKVEDNMNDAVNFFKDLSNKIKIRHINDNVANFRREMKDLVRNVAIFTTLFDISVKECRDDDKFSLARVMTSLFDVLLSFDDYSVRVLFEQYINKDDDSSEEKKDQQINNCFTTHKEIVRQCASDHFNFKLYEEKGFCGMDYKRFVDCMEGVLKSCIPNEGASIMIMGSLLFEFLYDGCHFPL